MRDCDVPDPHAVIWAVDQLGGDSVFGSAESAAVWYRYSATTMYSCIHPRSHMGSRYMLFGIKDFMLNVIMHESAL